MPNLNNDPRYRCAPGPLYGTKGRWCPTCSQYKHTARLKRVGDKASDVTYIPKCITCGATLLAHPPHVAGFCDTGT